MKLVNNSENNNQVIVNSVQDPFQKLKLIYPYMSEDVYILYLRNLHKF
jgi:hypothetical protein